MQLPSTGGSFFLFTPKQRSTHFTLLPSHASGVNASVREGTGSDPPRTGGGRRQPRAGGRDGFRGSGFACRAGGPLGAQVVFFLHLRGDTCLTPASTAARAGDPALGERARGAGSTGRRQGQLPRPNRRAPAPRRPGARPCGGPRYPASRPALPRCGRRLRALPVGAGAADVRRRAGGRGARPTPRAAGAALPGLRAPARGAGPRRGVPGGANARMSSHCFPIGDGIRGRLRLFDWGSQCDFRFLTLEWVAGVPKPRETLSKHPKGDCFFPAHGQAQRMFSLYCFAVSEQNVAHLPNPGPSI